MHVVAAFVASVVAFFGGVFAMLAPPSAQAAFHSSQQQTAAAAAPYATAATTTSAASAEPADTASPPNDTPAATAPPPTILERIVTEPAPQPSGISPLVLATLLATFEQQINQKLAAMPAAAAPAFSGGGAATPSYAGTWGLSQRIDSLTNTTITTPTITSPAITGGSISGATVSGTLSGTFSGTSSFTAATTSSLAISSIAWGLLSTDGSGTVIATSTPTIANIIATSTAAASTFAGGVGVGTTTPWGKLSITGAGTGTGLAFAVADSANTPRFVIQDNGNVGIGTTSPATTLSVTGSGYLTGGLGVGVLNTSANTVDVSQYGSYKQAGNTVLYASTTNQSVAVGASNAAAWMSATSSIFNSTAVGYLALGTTPMSGAATYNTAVGYQALRSNIIGTLNSGYGVNALYSNTTGSSNTANGVSALYYNQSATNTVAVGVSAAQGATGYSNQGGTYVGYKSGFGATTGSDYNTLFGYQSGYSITTGARNVLLGHSTIAASFNQVTTGSNNIAIGNDVAVPSATASNQLVIGNLIYGTGLSGTGATVSTGNIGIGTTTPWGKLSITGSGTGTSLALAVADSANTPRFVIQDNGNVGIGTTSPSARLDVGGYGSNELGFTPNNAIRLFDNYNGVSDISIKNINTNITAASAFQAFDSGGSYVSLTMPGTGNTAAPLFGLARASTTYLFSNTVGANPARNLAIGTLGANSLTFGTNNAARLTIDSSGNVGVGTTTPWGKLSIAGAGTGTGYAFIVADSSNTTRFTVQDNGSVTFGGNTITNSQNSAQISMAANIIGLRAANSGNAQLTILNAGNVGIGTTTPWGKLSITGSGTGTGLAFAVADSANTPRFVIQDNGNVGIGTTGPVTKLDFGTGSANVGQILNIYTSGNTRTGIGMDATGPGMRFYIPSGATANNYLGFGTINAGDGSTWSEKVRIDANGNVGIGTTSPDMLFTVGSATPVGSVAHFENSTGSCYINPTTTSLSCSSDARLKTNINTLASSTLDALLQLRPVNYNWKTESATSSPHTGFVAQEVQQIFPDLISQGPDGYYTLNYAGLTPYLTKAVQEIAAISGAFRTNLIAWLGDASNGIGDFFAKIGHFDEVHANELCAGTTCVNEQQLAALIAAANQSNNSPTVLTGTSKAAEAPTAPVIEINGNATSTITLGDLYLDLGARIVSPAADMNLGLVTLLDGATTTAVSIDTSVPGTHEIMYTITSPTTGLTGTAGRTVVIAPAHATSPSPTDPFTTPANDNASSTTQGSTAPTSDVSSTPAANDNASSTSLLIAS